VGLKGDWGVSAGGSMRKGGEREGEFAAEDARCGTEGRIGKRI
jgi:hypothetical protein